MKKTIALFLFAISTLFVFNIETLMATEENCNLMIFSDQNLDGYKLTVEVGDQSEPIYKKTLQLQKASNPHPQQFLLGADFTKGLKVNSTTHFKLEGNAGEHLLSVNRSLDLCELNHCPYLHVVLNLNEEEAHVNTGKEVLNMATVTAPLV